MTKTQQYLRDKKIREQDLPKIYVVKSTRDGVEEPVERQIVEIIENYSHRITKDKDIPIDKYILDKKTYPYEVQILKDESSTIDKGFFTGFGDTWSWSYFSTLSLEEANSYFNEEKTRIENKYKK